MDYSLIDNKPCIQYVNNNGRSVCYYENVQQRCCKTCETLKITLDSGKITLDSGKTTLNSGKITLDSGKIHSTMALSNSAF